jgi:DNA-binding transcriptional regulator YhcF (GntR family)
MESQVLNTGNDDFLYAQIAARIEKQIKQNVLKPGDKLPSVRAEPGAGH